MVWCGDEMEMDDCYRHFFLFTGQFEANGRLVPGTKCDYQFLSANYTAAEVRMRERF